MAEIDYLFPRPEDTLVLEQTNALIARYAALGLMLPQNVPFFRDLATRDELVVAVENDTVVGSAALTYALKDLPGAYEFGAWAVNPEMRGRGVGKVLYARLFERAATKPEVERVIAYANNNSAPLLLPLGTVIDQSTLPEGMFHGCLRCECKGKEDLPVGQRCVDVMIDLSSELTRLRLRT